jgi:Flp pilus assembly pilin Flp
MTDKQRLRAGFQRRVRRLRDDAEAGAQAAEYAMLGGVSAAACGTLIWWFKQPATLERVVTGIIDGLSRVIGGWF